VQTKQGIPDEVMKHYVFRAFSLKELCLIHSVSKRWKNMVSDLVKDHVELTRWLSPLDEIIVMEPTERLKKYLQIRNKITSLQKKKGIFVASDDAELFKAALENADEGIAHGLLKETPALANLLIEGPLISEHGYGHCKYFNVTAYRPLYYFWKFTRHDNANLVKLLLAHGANPNIPNKNRIYYCHLTSKKLEVEDTIRTIYDSTTLHSARMSMEIQSLIYIGYAEACLRDKKNTGEAINYFKKSRVMNLSVIQTYANKVLHTKKGFAFHYDDALLSVLHATFDETKNTVVQTQTVENEKPKKKICTIF
jgi:hypothetical protein